MPIPVQTLDEASFAPFGTLIAWSPAKESSGRGFHVVLRSEEPTGWRLAVSKVTARSLGRLAYHPDSHEMFAPVEGRAVLLVAQPGVLTEDAVQAFFLDRAACVAPGVWHGLIALSAEATLIIAENLEVTGVSQDLPLPIEASLTYRQII